METDFHSSKKQEAGIIVPVLFIPDEDSMQLADGHFPLLSSCSLSAVFSCEHTRTMLHMQMELGKGKENKFSCVSSYKVIHHEDSSLMVSSEPHSQSCLLRTPPLKWGPLQHITLVQVGNPAFSQLSKYFFILAVIFFTVVIPLFLRYMV